MRTTCRRSRTSSSGGRGRGQPAETVLVRPVSCRHCNSRSGCLSDPPIASARDRRTTVLSLFPGGPVGEALQRVPHEGVRLFAVPGLEVDSLVAFHEGAKLADCGQPPAFGSRRSSADDSPDTRGARSSRWTSDWTVRVGTRRTGLRIVRGCAWTGRKADVGAMGLQGRVTGAMAWASTRSRWRPGWRRRDVAEVRALGVLEKGAADGA